MPQSLLFAGVLQVASPGAYSLNRSWVDLVLLYSAGVVGCMMRIHDIPLAAAVLGLILGWMAERHFRRVVAIAEGDYSAFLTRRLSASLLFGTLLVLLGPLRGRRGSKNKHVAG